MAWQPLYQLQATDFTVTKPNKNDQKKKWKTVKGNFTGEGS